MRSPHFLLLVLSVCLTLPSGCRSVYYDVMEGFGREKRHILANRIEAGREDQQQAQEEFQDALERFQALTGFEGGDLEERYEDLRAAYERSAARAEAVRERIDSIETVAADLFDEWEDEIGEISRADLRRRSEARLGETRKRYQRVVQAMGRAEKRMDPVLVAFRDQVLFLKHNLNAAAIASLEADAAAIAADVKRLVDEMNKAIQEADAFLSTFDT